ncbi:pPIWI_RE module domain-containing protein [Thermoactinospora rubra]|uniref:pPIWI_RE module domain-containing protein n=1 Tax=Thermoactinospora rubra TaxID=1088767 RepID=UPI000A101E72|nr:DUF3962 domain-containing protein [Thermoactinospora rubra]
MAVNYERIRTASWLPLGRDVSHVARYRAMPFPEDWRDAVLDLCNADRPADAERYRTVPTHRFEQVLQAFAPDILVMPRPFHRADDGRAYWLYVSADVPDPLPQAVFGALVNRWLGDLRPEPEYRALLHEVRAQIAANPPAWEPVEAELISCPPTSGGTAAPLPHQFTLSTDWLARRILALGPYKHDAGVLKFRAVSRGPRDRGAELVSQPLPFEAGDETWWYSVVLNITLHTVPFDPLPRFHLHSGIRRWATRVNARTGRVHLPYRRRTSVLLRPRVPFLAGTPHSERYAIARLERRWDKEREEWTSDWVRGGPAQMLQGISLSEPFPDADEVLSAPASWVAGELRAGIVYSTAMGAHEVKAGLMSHQRSELAEWAAQALPDSMRCAAPLVRSRRADSRPFNAPPSTVKKEDKEQEEARRAAERRAGVAFAVSCLRPAPDLESLPVLEVRLLWQTAELRRAAVAALVGHLGLKGDGGEFTEADYEHARPGAPVVLEWQAAELTVRVRCIKLAGGLAGGLPLPEGVRHTSAAITDAVRARRVAAASWLAADVADQAPGLALVELDRRADFQTADHDPKFALRLGFAEAGLVTQFLAVPKKVGRYNSLKNLAHRALMAWDDGLRQLGARVHPEPGLSDHLPEGLRYVAIWLVRKNRTTRNRWATYVPVAVKVTPQHPGSGLARVEGWDPEADQGAGAWIPYPSLLLRLTRLAEVTRPAPESPSAGGRGSWRRSREEQRRETEEWLQKIRPTLRGTPTMLLAHAQNARSHWTWLQDGHIEPDRIRDGHALPRRLDPDLRLVRVRTAQGRETAQWWGIHPGDGPNGLPSHLWVSQEGGSGRVFWSTTPKPAQFKSSAVEADKLAPRPLRAGNRKGELTIDTDKPGWNPGLVEIAILGCHQTGGTGDDPESLALAVHQLRQPPDYPEALSLPLPLHLAGLAQEYVLPTLADENDESSVDTNDPPSAETDETADADPDAATAAGLESEPDPDDDQEPLPGPGCAEADSST